MKDKVTTTLKKIRVCSPCTDGWEKLLKSLGGLKKYGEDTPLTFKQIYESNGYKDTLWCLRSVDKKFFPLLRHFAADCAESVEQKAPRCIEAIAISRRYADGKATEAELEAARSAARSAAWSAAESAAEAAAWSAQMDLLFEYFRTGKRVKAKTVKKKKVE